MGQQVVTLTKYQALDMIKNKELGGGIRDKIKVAYDQTRKEGWIYVVLHLDKGDANTLQYQLNTPNGHDQDGI